MIEACRSIPAIFAESPTGRRSASIERRSRLTNSSAPNSVLLGKRLPVCFLLFQFRPSLASYDQNLRLTQGNAGDFKRPAKKFPPWLLELHIIRLLIQKKRRPLREQRTASAFHFVSAVFQTVSHRNFQKNRSCSPNCSYCFLRCSRKPSIRSCNHNPSTRRCRLHKCSIHRRKRNQRKSPRCKRRRSNPSLPRERVFPPFCRWSIQRLQTR